MNTEVVVYRIVSFLLLPVIVFLGLSTLLGLLSAAANPSALFGVLMIGSVVYYVISSYVFLTKGITSAKPCKPSLRSTIRITGIVTIIFCVIVLAIHIALVNDPNLLNMLAAEMIKQPGVPASLTQDSLIQSIQTVFTFFMVISLLLLLHIIMSFRLLKQYDALFTAK